MRGGWWNLAAIIQGAAGAVVLILAVITAARHRSRGAILLAVFGGFQIVMAAMSLFDLWSVIVNSFSSPGSLDGIMWFAFGLQAVPSGILIAAAALFLRDFSRRPLPAETGPAYRVEPSPPQRGP